MCTNTGKCQQRTPSVVVKLKKYHKSVTLHSVPRTGCNTHCRYEVAHAYGQHMQILPLFDRATLPL